MGEGYMSWGGDGAVEGTEKEGLVREFAGTICNKNQLDILVRGIRKKFGERFSGEYEIIGEDLFAYVTPEEEFETCLPFKLNSWRL